MKPITIIIPAYNRGDDLRHALRSLEEQITQNFQVIVSDDYSTEDLKSICEEKWGFEISYIRPDHNLGCGGNRDFALQYFYEHQSDYLMFLDSDDRLFPQATQRLGVAIQVNEADIVASNITHEKWEGEQVFIKAVESKTWLHGKIYRTSFLVKHNLHFDTTLRTNEDLAFNLTFHSYRPNAYTIDEYLYFWRQLDNSITHNTAAAERCSSADYIDAIYSVFSNGNINGIINLISSDILGCYSYWQRGMIYKTLTKDHARKMYEMLHNEQIEEKLIAACKMCEDFRVEQTCIHNENIAFFRESFIQWLLHFFTMEELSALALKYGDPNKTEKES